MTPKIKVLALCDSPTSATGFAQVSRNILNRLAKTGKYHIDVIGINYNGDYYDREKFPYQIYPAQPQGYEDMYGRGRVMNALNGQEMKAGLTPPWDILFTIQDPFIVEGLGLRFPFGEQLRVAHQLWRRTVEPAIWFKWIGYFPVDSALKENWVTRAIALPDYPVAYCDYGKDEMMKFERKEFETGFNLKVNEGGQSIWATIPQKSLTERLQVIPHGVDIEDFKPISKEESRKFRKEFFKKGVDENTYLVVNVSRNQPRKDLVRTLKVFSEFKKTVKNSHLYLHCKEADAGGSIHELARNFNLSPEVDYSLPRDFDAGTGYPIETVNKIYNAADLCITTTLGEGWGFMITEAMATKTPVIAPYITSIKDIFGGKDGDELENFRGIPVKAGSTNSEWICLAGQDNERIRPLTNVNDMVERMIWAYSNPDKVKKITKNAYDWVQGLSWDVVVKHWDELFQHTYDELLEERKLGNRIDKANRNEPCPCGSGLKFKKCHGGPDVLDKYRDWVKPEHLPQTARGINPQPSTIEQ